MLKFKKNSKGFTLIELIVVLAVFVLMLGTTVSIFMSMLGSQSRILKEQELLSQMDYTMEYISGLVRGAVEDRNGQCLGNSFRRHYYLLTHFDNVNNFYQGIKFITSEGVCQEFFFDTGGILKEKKGSQNSQNILSDKFEVKYARFVINGNKLTQAASSNVLTQHRVTFVLNVKTRTTQNPLEKIVQTTISQRNLND